jgi:hypothetical protein
MKLRLIIDLTIKKCLWISGFENQNRSKTEII